MHLNLLHDGVFTCNILYVCVCMIWINCLLYVLQSDYTFCIVPFGIWHWCFCHWLEGAKPLNAHQISYYCQTRSQLWHIWHDFCYKCFTFCDELTIGQWPNIARKKGRHGLCHTHCPYIVGFGFIRTCPCLSSSPGSWQASNEKNAPPV